MRPSSLRIVIIVALSVCWLRGHVVGAQCHWQAQASAGVQAYNGGVVSDHYGVLTMVECANSRSVILRATTLQNGLQVWLHDEIGGPAVLGASVSYSIGFPACSGYWTSTTRAGVVLLGYKEWYDSDVSSLAQAYCYAPPAEDPPGPCSSGTLETTTWSLTGTGEPVPSPQQTGLGLWRSVERSEGSFLIDEWAVVSWKGEEPVLRRWSSEAFKERILRNIASYRPQTQDPGTVLLVEANDHPRNRRFIPTPSVRPLEVSVDRSPKSGSQELWFRAEVAETGKVDSLMLLESADSLGMSTVVSALTENLRLQYADSRRHRVVIFGRADLSRDGRLRVRQAFPVLPQCCCGVDEVSCI